LLYTLNYSFLLPLIFILTYFRKVKSYVTTIILVVYLCIFFLLNFYFEESILALGKKNYYLMYTVLEYLSLSSLIYFSLPDKKLKGIIVVLSCVFIPFLLIYYSLEDYTRVDSIPIGLESLLLIIYVIYFFYLHFKKSNTENIYDHYSFWIITGILFYVAFTFFFNILANSLDHANFKRYFYYSYFGDILKNIFFSLSVVFISKDTARNKSMKSNSLPFLDMI
jgi:hypothetical protein